MKLTQKKKNLIYTIYKMISFLVLYFYMVQKYP